MPILGDTLVPAAPSRPGKYTLRALLGGQHKTTEEVPNLPDTSRHTSAREALKAVRLLDVEPWGVFFNGGGVGRCPARSTVSSAYAHIAKVMCRYQPVQLRTSY